MEFQVVTKKNGNVKRRSAAHHFQALIWRDWLIEGKNYAASEIRIVPVHDTSAGEITERDKAGLVAVPT